MVTLVSVVLFIFLVYVFFRNYPSIEKKHGYRIFLLPSLLLWHAATLTVNAYNSNKELDELLEIYWGVRYSEGAERTFYELLLYLHGNISYFYLFVASLCIGFVIYEVFYDKKFQSSAIHYLIRFVVFVGVLTMVIEGFVLFSTSYTLDEEYASYILTKFCIEALVEFIALVISAHYFTDSIDILEIHRKIIRIKEGKEDKKENNEKKENIHGKTQELLNLKTLLESGVIGKEEMEIMKKKILEG